MGVWLDRAGATLLDATLAATAITGLVVLAMLQCRQPARRRVWERAGLIATLALLPLAALNPVPRIDLRESLESFLSVSREESGFAISTTHEPGLDRGGQHGSDPCVEPRSGSVRTIHLLGRAAVVAYLAGVSIGLCGIGIGLLGVFLLVRRGSAPSVLSRTLYESLPFSGRFARPRLLISVQTSRPVVVGSFRPVILIPPELDEPVAIDRLRLSLLHELAHVENLDHRLSPVASLAEAIWFFLPTFWWIRDQMKLDQEFLADRRAVSHFGTSGHYASSLVDLAAIRSNKMAECSRASIVPPTISIPGVASALVQRVQMLLKCPFPIERETPIWWRWSSVLTLILATLASSGLTIRGFGDWWMSAPPPPVAEDHPPFRLSQLVITPQEHLDQPFDFRYRMPDEFTMTLEIMAEPSDLPRLQILGHSLAPAPSIDPARIVYRLWHRVQIRRLQGFELIEVDGQSIHPTAIARSPAPWLSLRPVPSQSIRIRDLRIE